MLYRQGILPDGTIVMIKKRREGEEREKRPNNTPQLTFLITMWRQNGQVHRPWGENATNEERPMRSGRKKQEAVCRTGTLHRYGDFRSPIWMVPWSSFLLNVFEKHDDTETETLQTNSTQFEYT